MSTQWTASYTTLSEQSHNLLWNRAKIDTITTHKQ